MTKIVISLERGPGDRPAGRLTTGSGQIIAFTGWLNLIRVLEEELLRSPPPPGADPAGGSPAAASEAM